jgi:RND family efflux transporter MFP subunit
MSEKRHSSLGIHGLHAQAAQGIRRLHMLGRARKSALIVLGLLGLGAVLVVGQRIAAAYALAEVSREQAMRYVNVVSPKVARAASQLRLPGTLQGFTEAPIYARTNGYVARWYKDIGDEVKQGELLALIDTPEVVQQLNEAKAAQLQAETNLQLAKGTLDRWEALGSTNAVSRQELDEKRNAHAVAAVAVTAAKATVQRLQDQLGYSRIVAPFSGIITRRNIDNGNLVDGSRLLFTLAKNDPLRVYVAVPQSYAAQVRAGDKAEVTLREMPGQSFTGSIVRTAGAIDTQSRTMQIEINLPNADGKLLPGAFAQVAIKIKPDEAAAGTLTLPSNTLLFRPEGLRAAVVSADGKVRLVPVTIARELGNQIEVNGLAVEDKVIINPSDSLVDGDSVSIVADKVNDKADDKADEKSKDKSKGSTS